MSVQPFKVDGVAIPTPSTYKFGIEDLSSEQTGRTLDGVMHKDVVAVKDYYECEWTELSWSDCAALLNALDGKEKVSFTHADPRVPNTYVTFDFYVGKRGGAALNLVTGKWEGIAFTFTRV